MHNYRNEQVDLRSLQVNQRITQEHMDSEHYIRWRYPQDIYPDTSGVSFPVRSNAVQRDHWIEFPDAVTSNAHWKFGRPEQWKNGQIETKLFYSGSASSTNTFVITLRGFRYKAGENTITKGPTQNTTIVPPGPAVANTRIGLVITTGYLPTTPEWEEHQYVLTRTGAHASDTNAGTFMLFSVRHRYIPAKHEV